MAATVKLPKFGLTMEEATINEWSVAVGDVVAQGQTIATIESEKVEMELPSPAGGVIAEHLLEIFLVADQAIDERDERLGRFDGFLAAPELGAEVEVVGDDRPRFMGGLDGFGGDLARGLGQGGEDAAGVQPAHAVFLK